ncbi:hypothetical protein [Rhodopseudomonas sp. P2A-2r]|uniref:hypothetical protein n=1 Tax=unclassified Rhodopseudomonas TaxID=2638247 RepID=UPI002234C223|nr:hypothetical protein [Rhodopseudomonas sp. P2A-2r]UZE50387.1 hypothetical protein ONR75_06695 [Rhodopseudomonas sp. P2A-2r]
MRLLPIDAEKTWASLKSQWRRAAEGLEEDFSSFSQGPFAALDPLMAQGAHKAGLYGLYDGSVPHAFCQVNKLLMHKFEGPVLRARFMTVSPTYDFGEADLAGYGQLLVELFSGIVWLSRNTMSAHHVLFHLRSPADAHFLAPLQAAVAASPFERFAIKGAWVECDLRGAAAAATT